MGAFFRRLCVVLAAALVSSVAAGSASAAIADTHYGWVRVDCSAPCTSARAAYSWNGTQWLLVGQECRVKPPRMLAPGESAYSCFGGGIREASWVYAWPAPWADRHWVWTHQHGWAAMHTSDLVYG